MISQISRASKAASPFLTTGKAFDECHRPDPTRSEPVRRAGARWQLGGARGVYPRSWGPELTCRARVKNSTGFPRAARCRPRSRRAAEQRDELAPLHSITSSARASSVGGTVRPSALAVLRLITSSYLVGACTGRAAGLFPLGVGSK